MWECTILRKSFQSVPPDAPKKKQNKDDKDDKKDPDGFQQPQSVVNVKFGGDPSFSKRAQKLLLREILSIEPAIQRPLKYSEVPITFSREDQWTSFSEPGKFPLVLDPVVQGSKLTRVLLAPTNITSYDARICQFGVAVFHEPRVNPQAHGIPL